MAAFIMITTTMPARASRQNLFAQSSNVYSYGAEYPEGGNRFTHLQKKNIEQGTRNIESRSKRSF